MQSCVGYARITSAQPIISRSTKNPKTDFCAAFVPTGLPKKKSSTSSAEGERPLTRFVYEGASTKTRKTFAQSLAESLTSGRAVSIGYSSEMENSILSWLVRRGCTVPSPRASAWRKVEWRFRAPVVDFACKGHRSMLVADGVAPIEARVEFRSRSTQRPFDRGVVFPHVQVIAGSLRRTTDHPVTTAAGLSSVGKLLQRYMLRRRPWRRH